jgi:hypothetical protein
VTKANTMRKNALNRSFNGALIIDGDYRRGEVLEALRHLRFDNAGNVLLPVVIDQDIRDLLIEALAR